ncbi:SRPBCC family protein [Botryobacter ruber]|uniref:SRPBCC family protein n=1 Tax=Botryobacter ruber TaxID=2171629 RepID=UPI000E0A1423|nr:SRPBCC family protein [Botryobacter ruber]
MENTAEKTAITVETTVQAPVEKVWKSWTEPQHITQWNNASDDWHTPRAENDVRVGGKFTSRMEARDGSMGFDFEGTYSAVEEHRQLAYAMPDGRKVQITFAPTAAGTHVTETFDAEQTHSLEMQQQGWQAILDNFKKYVENSGKLERMDFEISIRAGVDKVYRTMLEKDTYTAWTAAFNPGSYYEGSWEQGAKIVFLGTNEDGTTGGMVSRIKENIPNKFVSIEHLGLVQNGKEITSGPEVEGWAGALENYTFTESGGETLLSVDLDVNQEFKAYFTETWPKALQKLKELCETAA